MKTTGGSAVVLGPEKALRAMRRALGQAQRSKGPPDNALPACSIVIRLPAWVSRYAAISRASRTWLWCEPAAGAEADPYSQVTLRLPEGRYIINIFDAGSRTWVSSESAAGGPLVLSLPFSRAPVLAVVRALRGHPHTR